MKIIAINNKHELLEIETNKNNEKVDKIYLFNFVENLYSIYKIIKNDKVNLDFVRRTKIYLDTKSDNNLYKITHNSPFFQMLELEEIIVPVEIVKFLGLEFDIDVVSVLPILK